MTVAYLDLRAQYHELKSEIDAAVLSVLESAAFSGGPFVSGFETDYAAFTGSRYCVAVSSGSAALFVALAACGIGAGDEVIIPANTFIATAEAVSLTGATPVFVDCDRYYGIDLYAAAAAITSRTKAIIPVHLYGHPVDMERVLETATDRRLIVIEDCAQAHGATLSGRSVGSFSAAGCFSFYPGKNLGAYGEGGAIITDYEDLCAKMASIRDHGSTLKYQHDRIGFNFRLDGIQGAVLSVKLKHLHSWNQRRRVAASRYLELLEGVPGLVLPEVRPQAVPVYHVFALRTRNRDALREYLTRRGISTGIHYPTPCHRQKAYEHLSYPAGSLLNTEAYAEQLVSLPIHERITEEEIAYVCEAIAGFHGA